MNIVLIILNRRNYITAQSISMLTEDLQGMNWHLSNIFNEIDENAILLTDFDNTSNNVNFLYLINFW